MNALWRVGHGFDVHAFLPHGEKIVLGGTLIPHSRSIKAHSDGDVIIHALCDAILGALGLGDIGDHFPDSDPQYKNADSTSFLAIVWSMARERGYQLANADITVIAQAPRLAAHKATIRTRLSTLTGCTPSHINIKATTMEGLGALGSGEGIAAHAVVLLTKAENP